MRLFSLERVVFVAAFALFAACAAPGLSLRDAGELSTGAWTVGVAHETGFPLWCLLARAMTLLPLGEVVARVALLSALGGAATVMLACRAVRALGRDEPAAAVAGVAAAGLLAAGLTFFRASTVAEVYAPTAAALALGMLLLARAIEGDRRAGLALALLGGLSLGLHAHVRLLLGPAAIAVALWRLRRGDRWPLVAPTAVALGAAVVVYLPLRAARAPAENWADPRTLGGVAGHLSARLIRAAYADQMFHRVGAHLAQLARLTEGQLGLMALLFAAGGLVWLLGAPARRPLGLVLLVVLVGDALYSAALNPMAIDDLQDGHPTALVIAIAAGVGVLVAARRLGPRAAPWAAGAMAVLLCVPAALADVDAKLGLGPEARRWTDAALAEAPPRALVLTMSDDLSAGAMYEQLVAGARPDVTVLVRQQLWDKTEVAARTRRAGGEIRPETRLRRLVDAELNARAILWEPGTDAPPLPAEPLVPLYRLHATGAPLPPARPLAARIEALLRPARDPSVRKLEAAAFTDLGRLYLAHGEVPRAAALFATGLAVRPGDAVAETNLAVVQARQGDFAGALARVEGVLARDPDRLVARVNAGRYRLRLGDLDGAARDFATAHAQAPGDVGALVGLGRVAEARGDRAGALGWLRKAEKTAGGEAEVRAFARELGRE